MKFLLTLSLTIFILSSCKKSSIPAMPRPIDNNALQGKWVLTETKSANVGTDKPLNEEVITFSLPNHYLTSRNGLWLNEGEYSFSTNIVKGGETKNVIIFSPEPYSNISNVIELTSDKLYMSDFITYNAQTFIYTRQ